VILTESLGRGEYVRQSLPTALRLARRRDSRLH